MNVFESITSYLEAAYANTVGDFFNPSSFLSIGPLSVAFMIALAVVLYRLKVNKSSKLGIGHVIRALFPKRIFLHDSAKMDYLIYFINNGALVFLTLSAIITPSFFAEGIVQASELVGLSALSAESTFWQRFFFTCVLVLAWDFGATYAHYLKHKIPVLWEFHKVHHSAEVMTPMTALRRHPVDVLVGAATTTLTIGVVTGLWYLFVGTGVEPLTILGSLSGIYLWRLLGYNLRHSHIWISYGNFWNRIFISPAQHQIHHSIEAEHYDKNFGHIFSFWDGFFGTLYLPRHEERVKFGIEEEEMPQFQTIYGIYVTPVLRSLRLLKPAAQTEIKEFR